MVWRRPSSSLDRRGRRSSEYTGRVSYEQLISDVVKAVEGVGAGIMVIGGLCALVIYVPDALSADARPGSYFRLRRNLGRRIMLGLEVLIVADVVHTIIDAPTFESVT